MSSTAAPAPSNQPTPLTMAERIAAEQAENPLAHEWIAAAEVAIDTRTARRASFRGSFRTQDGMRVDALETYCRKCRRPLDAVGNRDCEAKIDNTHLIGGDLSTRAKRKVPELAGTLEFAPAVDRRRLQYGGYSVHAGK